jgi:hypothetical protein
VEQLREETAMPARQIELQKKGLMASLYLGVAGVKALVAMGLIIAFM